MGKSAHHYIEAQRNAGIASDFLLQIAVTMVKRETWHFSGMQPQGLMLAIEHKKYWFSSV